MKPVTSHNYCVWINDTHQSHRVSAKWSRSLLSELISTNDKKKTVEVKCHELIELEWEKSRAKRNAAKIPYFYGSLSLHIVFVDAITTIMCSRIERLFTKWSKVAKGKMKLMHTHCVSCECECKRVYQYDVFYKCYLVITFSKRAAPPRERNFLFKVLLVKMLVLLFYVNIIMCAFYCCCCCRRCCSNSFFVLWGRKKL